MKYYDGWAAVCECISLQSRERTLISQQAVGRAVAAASEAPACSDAVRRFFYALAATIRTGCVRLSCRSHEAVPGCACCRRAGEMPVPHALHAGYSPVKSPGEPLGTRLRPSFLAIFLSTSRSVSCLYESTYSRDTRFFLNRKAVFEIIRVSLEVEDSQGGRKSHGNVLLQHLGAFRNAQEENPHPGDCQLPGALLSTAGCLSSPIDAYSRAPACRPAPRARPPERFTYSATALYVPHASTPNPVRSKVTAPAIPFVGPQSDDPRVRRIAEPICVLCLWILPVVGVQNPVEDGSPWARSPMRSYRHALRSCRCHRASGRYRWAA